MLFRILIIFLTFFCLCKISFAQDKEINIIGNGNIHISIKNSENNDKTDDIDIKIKTSNNPIDNDFFNLTNIVVLALGGGTMGGFGYTVSKFRKIKNLLKESSKNEQSEK